MVIETIIYLVWALSGCLVAVSIASALRHKHPLKHRN